MSGIFSLLDSTIQKKKSGTVFGSDGMLVGNRNSSGDGGGRSGYNGGLGNSGSERW